MGWGGSNLGRSATEAQLGLGFELKLKRALESELEDGFQIEF